MTAGTATPVTNLLEALLARQPLALARAITAVENGTRGGRALLEQIQPHLGNAAVVGITGPPGAGKSTLCSSMVKEWRKRGKTVGILAVDPSSPFTGGAILGDRIRMAEHDADSGVFVRSLASRGHLGGLSPTATRVIDVMDAAGRDIVIVETVGAGQSEVEIAGIADTAVVVCAPGLGDEVQAIKAGILEIADILVVNKGDLPLADRTRRQLTAMLQLREARDWTVPVLMTSAISGNGVTHLVDAVVHHHQSRPASQRPHGSLERVRRQLAQETARVLERRLATSDDADVLAICREVQTGALDMSGAVARLTADGWPKTSW